MTTKLNKESAKIYAFPAGGRTGLLGRRDGLKGQQPSVPRSAKMEFGNGWYHEEALCEADLTRKH